MNIPFGQLERTLSKSERYLVLIFALGLIVSFFWLAAGSFLQGTAKAPAFGGSVTIGMAGAPHSINPVLAPTNEVDKALVKLIYPSLLQYDKKGNLVPSLAKEFAVGDKGRVYEFSLREGVLWDDGIPLDAHDIVFTIKTIQDPKISSPLFRLWEGVTVEAVNDQTVRFTLPDAYAFFLQNVTIGILPRHIWEEVRVENFALSEKNKEPVGAGPYRLASIEKSNGTISSITFSSNQEFFGDLAFIPSLIVRFYANTAELIQAFQKREVTVASIPFESFTPLLSAEKNSYLTSFPLPRYFAIFLNEKQNAALGKKEVREALLTAIDRDTLISSIFGGEARKVISPIPATLEKYHVTGLPPYDYNPARARELLQEAGFTKEKPLAISFTSVRDSTLGEVAKAIAGYWEMIGIKVTITSVELGKLRDEVLQNRTYEAFLFGQALALEPDPFSLWHSSQSEYPGLNLTSYKNTQLDKVLEELRQTFEEERRKELFETFQTTLVSDLPALFLYSPYHHVLADSGIQGITQSPLSSPEDYLNQVSQWYIFTKRVSR